MKTIEEIYQEMLATFAGRSGYFPNDACDLAVRLYAMAAQVQTLHVQAEWVMKQAFPQTAEGEYLDYHAQTRGLIRAAAVAAEGTLRFYAAETAVGELVIPVGTVCLTGQGGRFETTEAAAVSKGESYVDVKARAVESGTAGNVGSGAVVLMAVAPAGIQRCANLAPFTGGAEQEDDESLRKRILESFRRLPNGANAAFYEQEAMSVPGVAAAKAVGRARGIGTVDVYVATTAGVPEEELLREIRERLQEKREIAVDVKVLAPEEKTVDITAVLTAAEGYSYQQAAEAAEAALRAHFTGALLGQGVTLAELGNILYHQQSVANYAISAPAVDVAGAVGVLPVLGTVTLTEVK